MRSQASPEVIGDAPCLSPQGRAGQPRAGPGDTGGATASPRLSAQGSPAPSRGAWGGDGVPRDRVGKGRGGWGGKGRGRGPWGWPGLGLTGAVAAGGPEGEAELPPQQAPGQAAPQGAHGRGWRLGVGLGSPAGGFKHPAGAGSALPALPLKQPLQGAPPSEGPCPGTCREQRHQARVSGELQSLGQPPAHTGGGWHRGRRCFG